MAEVRGNALARLRRERPRLYAAARLGLIVAALVVLFNLVLPDVVSAIPFPGLPDLPDLPDWARWLRLVFVIAIVALLVIGEIAKQWAEDEPDPSD
jgi:hypothetical protein